MKILVAYDEQTSFERVIDHAVKRAKRFNASVHLIRTCSPDRSALEISQMTFKLKELRRDRFKNQGVEGEAHVLIRGLAPGEDIVQYAREKDVDEIIMGIKKRSKVGKALFGSTAQFVILEAHCPVLTIK
ncbi:universal stress protein [Desulfospira joergensenii]|uniref:universal stress protein n=1 Tax=Desulfospira joergensenii TaxID=53329 RepID=UPI0003B4D5E5|nr:universal stress protein [Desulfospira joergensenii]